jgi:hypothetical protein
MLLTAIVKLPFNFNLVVALVAILVEVRHIERAATLDSRTDVGVGLQKHRITHRYSELTMIGPSSRRARVSDLARLSSSDRVPHGRQTERPGLGTGPSNRSSVAAPLTNS